MAVTKQRILTDHSSGKNELSKMCKEGSLEWYDKFA